MDDEKQAVPTKASPTVNVEEQSTLATIDIGSAFSDDAFEIPGRIV